MNNTTFIFNIILLLSPFVYSFATFPKQSRRIGLKTSIVGAATTYAGPEVSSQMKASQNDGDIAVVGCGVLGTSLCKQLLSSSNFQGRKVTGITKTTNNHESIKHLIQNIENESLSYFDLCTFDDISLNNRQFKNIIFCAPPSGFDDYPAAIQNVIDTMWSGGGDNGDGIFIFTSSGGIYGPGNGETVTEITPIPPSTSQRSQRLIDAEANVIKAGGCILRLAGLYTLERGAHNYWIEKNKSGDINGSKDGIINLLHYDDAAGSCIAALQTFENGKSRGANDDSNQMKGKIFLISDGQPTTRGGICESALKSKRYGGMKMPGFGDEDAAGKGKIYDGSWSNEFLSWKPMYPSFDEFMQNS